MFWDRDILLDFLTLDGEKALEIYTDADVERIFDTEVSTIPLLDNKGRLKDIASRKHYPISKEEKIKKLTIHFHLSG